MKVIITSGYFNPIHTGHINLFKEARKLGDLLVVIVNNDKQVGIKGSSKFMPEQERLGIVESIRYVDEVFLSIDKTQSIAESLKAVASKFEGKELFFAKGGDRNAENIPEEERKVCQEFNIKIISGIGGGKVQSSSWLIKNIINNFFRIKIMEKISGIKSMEVLGNKIDIVQIPDVIELMDFWIQNESSKCHWIVNTGMHGIAESEKNKEFKKILASCDLWTPDGISLVWLAKLNGFKLKRRVAGPDLFHEFLTLSVKKGYKNYFYGDTEETLAQLKKKLSGKMPGIKMESFSPPFRELTSEEKEKIMQNINSAKPDVLWVGLGLPKQEIWIFKNKEKLNVPVVIGVGASFRFEAGIVKRAPSSIGSLGFEWLWRLFTEPKKTWKRVVLGIPLFIFIIISNFFRTKKN